MGSLNDQHKIQVDEKKKKEKFEKLLKKYIIINFQTVSYNLVVLRNTIHLIGNYKFTRSFSILRLPREKRAKTAK